MLSFVIQEKVKNVIDAHHESRCIASGVSGSPGDPNPAKKSPISL
ncbi:hypothetical protein ECP03047993_2892 [Escherichia coli P0304799.3]|nr:hypothetical protein ECP03047993_2892 [Escherichia coli P0304799.3]